ncbi:MAG: hypothetical protein EBR09_11245 [Proteobacteria bacterium]|nr:hypothetical protein [Pseudomonadota bacterium]
MQLQLWLPFRCKQSGNQVAADLLPIPSGYSFIVSCTKKLNIPKVNNPLTAKSNEGIEAAIVLAELSQTGGVKICSEYWANTDDREKALLIEDRTADCKTRDSVTEAELSLKTPCPQPKTGSQTLNKSGEKAYFRSTLYISGAGSEQLKKLSAGLTDAMPTQGAEVKKTENLQ